MMLKSCRTVVCAMSGGVDSAVSAHLLKRRGHRVIGVFMRNWDPQEEETGCRNETDYADAFDICNKLRIPLQQVNFVKEYWNEVFSKFLADLELGLMPNPDVQCNEFIKFNHLYHHAINVLGADALATGHYARVENTQSEEVKLLTATDVSKDQTLFVHRAPQTSLQRCVFPVGALLKSQVKQIAAEIGLKNIASKKESMGICFIGKRNFKTFVKQYLRLETGPCVDLETGRLLGEHNGVQLHVPGERMRLTPTRGNHDACGWFVALKDVPNNRIYVVNSSHHPALFSFFVKLEAPHWVRLRPRLPLRCAMRLFHNSRPVHGSLQLLAHTTGEILVTMDTPARHVVPGQYVALYQGEECLGGAMILESGPSLYDLCNKQDIDLNKLYS